VTRRAAPASTWRPPLRSLPALIQEEVIRIRPVLTGQQVAQVSNPDPFAPPVWRAPVYHTPGWLIAAVQVARTLWAIARFITRHPLGDLAALALLGAWRLLGWPGPLTLAVLALAVLTVWRLRWPASFTRWVRLPALSKWRRWHYYRLWPGVMTIGRLAPQHRGRNPAARAGQGDLDRLH
jgi:hypothetical protein